MFGTLTGLVVLQSLVASLSAVLMAAVLEVEFKTERWIGVIAALVYAAEPMALFYERFVMTETFAMLGLASLILVEMIYLRRQRLIHLVWLALLSTCIVALRIVYLPALLISMVLLPSIVELSSSTRQAARSLFNRFFHVAFVIVLTLICHQVYKMSYSHLSGDPASHIGKAISGLDFAEEVASEIMARDVLPIDVPELAYARARLVTGG